MKNKLIPTVICVLVLVMISPTSVFGSSEWEADAVSVVVDLTVTRPITCALALLGSAVFVVSLPVTIPAGSVKKVAHALVAVPARDTFTRPVGDWEDFLED